MKQNPSTPLTGVALFLLAAVFLAAPLATAKDAPAKRPNIILIMGDDMGYSDLGCYGGEINTPVLDGLAAKGVRFTQFYNTARCCPTRASLLTGLYPHQAGVGHMMSDRGVDGYRGDLNRKCVTIAEALKPAGYATYLSGKWHVTKEARSDKGPKKNWPLQRGFDRFYGTIHGAGSFFDPNSLTRGNTFISPYADPEYKPKAYYYTDAISDHAVRFIKEHNDDGGKKPFFMYVAYTAAHWPMHALPGDIAKYKGKYDTGYAPVRKKRLAKMKQLGLLPADAKLSLAPEKWADNKHQAWDARNMEVYAAMVDSMDQGIGRIVAALQAKGELDNTLILFFQDNGACAEGFGRRGNKTRADKPTLPPMAPTDLQRKMVPRQTRDGYPVLMGSGVLAGPADTYIAYGRGWANASNTPFREYKHWVHEGGISTPLIAHWPKGIPASRHGKLERQPGHLIDLMATCVDLADATYPKEKNGQSIKPMEGVSLVPAFAGKDVGRPGALYWEHEGNRAVRLGKWKLVAKGNGKWELYDVVADRSELNDLATKMPEKVTELDKLWTTYANRANVLPRRGPKKTKKTKKKNANKSKKK